MSKQNQNAAAGQAVPTAPSNIPDPTPTAVPDEIAKLDEEGAKLNVTVDTSAIEKALQEATGALEASIKERDDLKGRVQVLSDSLTVSSEALDNAVKWQKEQAERAEKAEATVKSLEEELQHAQQNVQAADNKFDELRNFLTSNGSMPPGVNEVDHAIELLKAAHNTTTDPSALNDKLLHVARYFVSKARYNKHMDNWSNGVDPHLTMEQRIAVVTPAEIDEALAYQFPVK